MITQKSLINVVYFFTLSIYLASISSNVIAKGAQMNYYKVGVHTDIRDSIYTEIFKKIYDIPVRLVIPGYRKYEREETASSQFPELTK